MLNQTEQKPSLLSIFMAFASWPGKGREKARKGRFCNRGKALPMIDSYTLRMMQLNGKKEVKSAH